MAEPRLYPPDEVAGRLHVSPSTLRRWTNEFSEFLSETARPEARGGEGGPRRYTDADVSLLKNLQDLLAEGLTYVQVGKRLEAERMREAPAPAEAVPEAPEEPVRAVGPSLREASPLAPAVTMLADTLHTVADGQQLLLGSQQANRDLLTVLLRDNFSLKEENAKLRDRMLEIERDLSEIRRTEGAEREAIIARIQEVELQVTESGLQPQRIDPAQRQGCLASLFGILP